METGKLALRVSFPTSNDVDVFGSETDPQTKQEHPCESEVGQGLLLNSVKQN